MRAPAGRRSAGGPADSCDHRVSEPASILAGALHAILEDKTMPVFPSVEWFKAVADIVNKDEGYRKLGNCDARVGVQVGDRMFEIDFEAFEVTDVKELEATTPRD